MWCSTACPTTRSTDASGTGIVSASATRPSTSRPEARRVARRHLDHARREVRDRAPARDPALHQVEQEEPGAAAQLEGVVVGLGTRAPTARKRSTANVVQRSSNEIDHFSSYETDSQSW